MDEYPPAMNNEPTNPKPNRLHALAFLEIGLFEFGFAAVVLLLLFGTLNYFNILPISDVFPKYLSWLPRQTPPQKKLLYTPANPSPTPATAGFNYDVKKAETLLTQYIKDNIKLDFLPEKIEVKQRLTGSGKQDGTDYAFGVNWTKEQQLFQSNFHFDKDTNNPRDMEILARIVNAEDTTTNAAFATDLTDLYFKNTLPSSEFECGLIESGTFCEKFSITPTGKQGYGLVSGDHEGSKITLMFSCFIPKKSIFYEKATSCLTLEKK